MNMDGMAEMESGAIHYIQSPDGEKLRGDFVMGIDFGARKSL
jgi:hypothetical protein